MSRSGGWNWNFFAGQFSPTLVKRRRGGAGYAILHCLKIGYLGSDFESSFCLPPALIKVLRFLAIYFFFLEVHVGETEKYQTPKWQEPKRFTGLQATYEIHSTGGSPAHQARGECEEDCPNASIYKNSKSG